MRSIGERHQLIRPLGHGGMAEVWLAVTEGPGGFRKTVAIKRAHAHLAASPAFRDMFRREARLAARMTHKNIVQIYELGEEDERDFLVMEYVEGVSLRVVLDGSRKAGLAFSPAMARYVATEMLNGLEHAHALADEDGAPLDLVHRDVSPQNVLLSTGGEVKLIDFGIAKTVDSTLTSAGVLKGKIGYMSPEQAHGRPLDRRSDVFSAGLVLYEMLTGRRAFSAKDDVALLAAVQSSNVDLSTIHESLQPILARALARDPAERFGTARLFRQALLDCDAAFGRMVGGEELGARVLEIFREPERVPPPLEVEPSFDVDVVLDPTASERQPQRRLLGPWLALTLLLLPLVLVLVVVVALVLAT